VISYLLGREVAVDRGLEERTAVGELPWGSTGGIVQAVEWEL